MDIVEAMRVTVAIARRGSFSSAGRDLGLSGPSVSRIVAELEANVGARLFNRTTRQLSLTEAGEEFVQKSAGILEELDQMRSSVRDRHESPRGRLRISCVTAFGNECLAPAIPGFRSRFPQLEIAMELGNRLVDLIGEQFDVAIRVGPLRDSSLVAQRISTQRVVFVAAPKFCQEHGMPRSLDEIGDWPSVTQISGEWGRAQRFIKDGKPVEFEVPDNVTMNSARAVRNACIAGGGYSLVPDFMVAKDIEQGRLVRLLSTYESAEQPIYAYYAQRQHTPQKIRVFVDYLIESFNRRGPQGTA